MIPPDERMGPEENISFRESSSGISDNDIEMEILGEQSTNGEKVDELTEAQIEDLLGEQLRTDDSVIQQNQNRDEKKQKSLAGSSLLIGQVSIGDGELLYDQAQASVSNDEELAEDNLIISGKVSREISIEKNTVNNLATFESSEEDSCFLADSLLIDENPEDSIDADDICVLNSQESSSNAKLLKEATYNGRQAVTSTINEEIMLDDDEKPESVTDRPKYNRLAQQMLRVYLERLRSKDPTSVLIHHMRNDTRKLQQALRCVGEQQNKLNNDMREKIDEVKLHYALALEAEKKKVEQLSQQLKQANLKYNIQCSKRQNQNRETLARIAAQPYTPPEGARTVIVSKKSTPIVTTFSSLATSEPPATDLPNRINISIPLSPAPRQCTVDNPFDALPPHDYPPGMLKPLHHNGTDKVDLLISTEYDNFLISKKIHGTIKYKLPDNKKIIQGSSVRIYYWIESLNESWIHSQAARIMESGTKFSLSFHSDQKLYQGDRVSLIAYVFIDQTTKFVSKQIFFNMRRPVAKTTPIHVDLVE